MCGLPQGRRARLLSGKQGCVSGKTVLVLTAWPWPVLPLLSHQACRPWPTFGCAVYVGHAAILQLHRLAILKGERLCKGSSTNHPQERAAMEGDSGRAARPRSEQGCARTPHLSVSSPGGCTQRSRPPAGSPALQAASLLGDGSKEMGQAQVCHMLACFGRRLWSL